MGIAGKHAYRFVFLKSDNWQNVRLDALQQSNAKCRICGFRSIKNDAHHIWYPVKIWDTKKEDLVILCRDCHELIQNLFIQRKTRAEGIDDFIGICNSLKNWMVDKRITFDDISGIKSENKKKKAGLPIRIWKDRCCHCGKNTQVTRVDIISGLQKIASDPPISDRTVELCQSCEMEWRSNPVRRDLGIRPVLREFNKWMEGRCLTRNCQSDNKPNIEQASENRV